MTAFFIIGIIMALLVGGGFFMTNIDKTPDVDYFHVEDYEYFVNQFPSDRVLGPIDSAEMAKEKAEFVWIEIYGYEVQDKKPYKILYDKENRIWMVQGELNLNFLTDNKELIIPAFGGVPYIIIQEWDGKVLAVWHDK